jgi:transposase
MINSTTPGIPLITRTITRSQQDEQTHYTIISEE